MRRILALLLAALSLFGCFCVLPADVAAAESVQAVPARGDFAPGEALVLFDAAAAYAGAAHDGGLNRSAGGGLFGTQVGVEKIYGFSQHSALNRAAQTEEDALAIALVNGRGMDTAALLSHLGGLGFVKAAEPNYRIYPDALPNDPYVEHQWGIVGSAGVHPEALWDALNPPQQPDVVVAVVDTGVDYLHPDLQGRVVENKDLYFDAYPSGGAQKAMDYNGHGTHVAGIIAAETNNGKGVAGVAGEAPVKILPVKVFAPNGSAYTGDLVAGLHHVIQHAQSSKIVAANMSLGGNWHSSEIVSYAMTKLGEADVLAVRSAGNDGLSVEEKSIYPSYFENPYTVSVGALDEDGALAEYSHYGEHSVHIAAPGTDILSTWPRGMGRYDEQEQELRTDGFESGGTYGLSYTWLRSSPPLDSGAVTSSGISPSPDGYGSSTLCLSFDAVQSEGHYNYRIELPNGMGELLNEQLLSLRLRMEGVDGTYQASFAREEAAPSYWLPCHANEWNFVSTFAQSDGKYQLVISCGQAVQAAPRISIDNMLVSAFTYEDYEKTSGTSMAAPHAAGAYALLSAAMPGASMAERRARLLGSSRYQEELVGKVNTQGAVDLRRALSDASLLAPVIDSIEQNGDTVTVKGWFWGDEPSFRLGGQNITGAVQRGSDGDCTLEFPLGGISGVQTLTVTKPMEDGPQRSYRMRYDYSPQGNMLILNSDCAVPDDAMRHDLFAHGGHIFHLMSTVDGYTVQPYTTGGAPDGSAQSKSCAPRAARDDFATFVDEAAGILYIYDIDHIHRYDMNARRWLEDIDGPYPLDLYYGGFCTGAVAVYDGRLMVIGGEGQSGSGFIWSTLLADLDAQQGSPVWTSSGLPAGFPAGPARAVALEGKLIVFSQRTSAITGTSFGYIHRYDGAWTSLVPGDRDKADLWRCSLAAHGDEILLFGNYNDAEETHSIRAYNPAGNTWRELPCYGTGLAYSIRGTVLDGRIYGLTAVQDFGRYILQSTDVPPPAPAPAPAPAPGGGWGGVDVDIEFLEWRKAQQAEEIVPATPPATGGALGPQAALLLASASLLLAARRMQKKKPRRFL